MYWGINECKNPAICKNFQYWQAKVNDSDDDKEVRKFFNEHLVEDFEYLVKQILKKEEERRKS